MKGKRKMKKELKKMMKLRKQLYDKYWEECEELEQEELDELGIVDTDDTIECMWDGNLYDYFDLTAGFQEYDKIREKSNYKRGFP